MNNALQDQLLKAGLITQEQVQQAKESRPKPAQRKKPPRKPQNKPANKRVKTRKPAPAQIDPGDEAVNLAAAFAARAAQERREKEQAERARREAAAKRKAIKAKIKKLINENTLNEQTAELAYNFVVGDKVKRVYVTGQQNTALAKGEIAIVFQDGQRCLIPTPIAQQLQTLDPERIIILREKEENTAEGDDPYAAYQIPDDLIW